MLCGLIIEVRDMGNMIVDSRYLSSQNPLKMKNICSKQQNWLKLG